MSTRSIQREIIVTSTNNMSNKSWFLQKNLLSQDEQLRLFSFIQQHDTTDWDNIPPCMNPSPKTLDLLQNKNGESSRTVCLDPNNDNNAVVQMLKKALDSVDWYKKGKRKIKTLSMAVLKYCPAETHSRTIGSTFPPHIDHCNDGSWVVLISLGCTANFRLKCPSMTRSEMFEMESGDVLVFDPSSEAAILHGVDSIQCGEDRGVDWAGLGEHFEVLSCSRFGVQCRVSFDSDE
jgi:hypothetical protein